MVSGLTNGIDSALIVVHTRILALLRDTGQHARTVAVDRTLGLALGEGVTLVVSHALADGAAAGQDSALGIGAAGAGVAGVDGPRWGQRGLLATDVGVAPPLLGAAADRVVVGHLAKGGDAT